jgi:diguanylate cyclase (GGDEF)-like protein/PAS domain S-box-containing protein
MVDTQRVHSDEGAATLDDDAREAALQTLLVRYPEAPVAAVSPSGVYVEMPSSVPLTGQRLIEARSSLHFVVPEDRKAVTDAFHRAVIRGVSSVAVHLANDPERTANLFYFDVRARHGVFVLVLADYTGVADVHSVVVSDSVMPRFASTKKNETSVFLDIDESTTKILGWGPDQMVGRRSIDFIHPDDQGRAINSWMEMAAAPGASSRTRVRHLCRDGSWRWLEITNRNAIDEPDVECVVSEIADISDEMAALESVRAREQLLDRLAEALPLGLFQVDTERQVTYTNDRLHQIIGSPPAATVDQQMANVVADDQPVLREALDAVLEDGRNAEIEIRIQPPGGVPGRLCNLSLRALTTEMDEIRGAIACVADVTESAQMRHELELLAMLDPVTECHNRRSIMSALEAELQEHTEEWPGAAVIFVDIDRFKSVNDTLGHAAGDELLAVVADRLRKTVRAGDVVGRLGGDEFLVVCPRVRDPEETMNLGQRIASALERDVNIASVTVGLRASIGVAWTQATTTGADALVGEADAAMYESKRQDVGRPVLFHPALRHVPGTTASSAVQAADQHALPHDEDVLRTAG